jgi:hypothetical protein
MRNALGGGCRLKSRLDRKKIGLIAGMWASGASDRQMKTQAGRLVSFGGRQVAMHRREKGRWW